MLQAMYNGVSGMDAEQQWMDTIGNNIANVNTTGYKAQEVSFEDQLSQTLQGATAATATDGGTDPIQTGLGVAVGAISTNTSQGGLLSTSVPSDLAISGNGYFLEAANGNTTYTRDGTLTLDSSGNLVSSATGANVLGWQANDLGAINNTAQITASSTLNIGIGTATATGATTSAGFSGNLNSQSGGTSFTTGAFSVYDSTGASNPVTLTFTQPDQPAAAGPSATDTGADASSTIAAGTYYVGYTLVDTATGVESPLSTANSVTVANDHSVGVTLPTIPNGYTANIYMSTSPTSGFTRVDSGVTQADQLVGPATLTAASSATAGPAYSDVWQWTASGAGVQSTSGGQIAFNSDGQEMSNATGAVGTYTGTINIQNTDDSATPMTIAPDFTGISSQAGTSAVQSTAVSGSAPGTLQSYNVGDTGVITGIFSNGATRALGQIAMANFVNAGGLQNDGDNQFSTTANSGTASIGTAGTNGLGNLNVGYLEQSNVNLSNEFTNMIVSQRGFQANTQIIQTVNTLLGDLVQITQ